MHCIHFIGGNVDGLGLHGRIQKLVGMVLRLGAIHIRN